MIKLAMIVPTFRDNYDDALALTNAAAAHGIDAVFCYDHLWPMGRPERPALAPFPLLARVLATVEHIRVGTLVARIGLVDNATLVSQFETLASIDRTRVIAALGTGDSLSRAENEAYGIDFAPAALRRAGLEEVATTLRAAGTEVWIGGGGPPTIAIAEHHGLIVNLWQPSRDHLDELGGRVALTWAGPGPTTADALAQTLRDLEARGVLWAVFAYPCDPSMLVAVARDTIGWVRDY